MQTIHLGADHAALDLKTFIKENLEKTGKTIKDHGPFAPGRVDYPDYAKQVALAVKNTPDDLGILLCGSGIGMSIAANKIDGIRAAHVQDPLSAKLSRQHNDANILCLGARILGPELAWEIVLQFLNAGFEGGRHKDRLVKITALEKGE